MITEADKHVHVSGHGSSEELKLLLSLVRPRYMIPIHGEFRQLARHARIAEVVTGGLPEPVTVLMAEDGDIVRFDAQVAGCTTRRRPAGCSSTARAWAR